MRSSKISPWAVVAALLLPPLGVFLDRGISGAFWICCALTLLAFVPGMFFALYTVTIGQSAP